MLALWAAVTFRRPCASAYRTRALILAERDEALRGGGTLFELDPRVQVFGILTDDDEVEVLVAPSRARNRENRAKAYVQIERLAQSDVDAAEALTNRCRARRFKRNVIFADRLQRGFRNQTAGLFQRGLSERLAVKGQGELERL